MVLKILFPGDSGNLNTPAALAGFEADTVYVAYSTTDSSYLIFTYRNNDLIDLRDMSDDSDAVIFAGADHDTVLGSAGLDQYFDQSGNDLVLLGDGEDSVRAGVGNDTLDGGDGRDWLSFGLIYRDVISGYDTAPTGVVFDMAKTTRQDLGFWGKDVIRNFEQVSGTALDDKIYGDAQDNYIDGDNGSDLLLGRAGNDTLKGWNGADTMVGGRGIDTFVMEGPEGDVVRFLSIKDSTISNVLGASDTLEYFGVGQSKIDLSRIDANPATQKNDAFIFRGTGSFSSSKGEVRLEISGGHTLVHVDIDGDGASEMSFWVTGVTNLTAGDFIL